MKYYFVKNVLNLKILIKVFFNLLKLFLEHAKHFLQLGCAQLNFSTTPKHFKHVYIIVAFVSCLCFFTFILQVYIKLL